MTSLLLAAAEGDVKHDLSGLACGLIAVIAAGLLFAGGGRRGR